LLIAASSQPELRDCPLDRPGGDRRYRPPAPTNSSQLEDVAGVVRGFPVEPAPREHKRCGRDCRGEIAEAEGNRLDSAPAIEFTALADDRLVSHALEV
jgi:hypothetical protein